MIEKQQIRYVGQYIKVIKNINSFLQQSDPLLMIYCKSGLLIVIMFLAKISSRAGRYGQKKNKKSQIFHSKFDFQF